MPVQFHPPTNHINRQGPEGFGVWIQDWNLAMLARLSMKTATAGAALAAAGLLLVPASANAQAYTYQGSGRNNDAASYSRYDEPGRYGDSARYDPDPAYGQTYRTDYDATYCRNDRRQRQGAGVAIGATFGAVIGSQLAARGRRTEGSVLGGLLGAAVGASVAGGSARDCGEGSSRYDTRYSEPYGEADRYGYADDRYQDQGYGSDQAYRDYGRDYDRSGPNRSNSDCRPVPVRGRGASGRNAGRYAPSCPTRY